MLSRTEGFIYQKYYPAGLVSTSWAGLVTSWASLTSWGEGASFALVVRASSDGITIKLLSGVDVLQQPASHPILLGWLKLNLALL